MGNGGGRRSDRERGSIVSVNIHFENVKIFKQVSSSGNSRSSSSSGKVAAAAAAAAAASAAVALEFYRI